MVTLTGLKAVQVAQELKLQVAADLTPAEAEPIARAHPDRVRLEIELPESFAKETAETIVEYLRGIARGRRPGMVLEINADWLFKKQNQPDN